MTIYLNKEFQNSKSDLNKLIGSDKITNQNVYSCFSKIPSDSNHFILRYYQTIPKYYFLDSNNRTLICNYGLGTGKTAAAVFIASYYLKQLNKAKFMNKTAMEYNKIIVLGSWVTIDAFQRDILKPEFHFTTYEQINDFEVRKASPFKEVREEAEKDFDRMKKHIFKNFIFKNFQSIFNMAFPNLNEQKYVQHVDSLIRGWKNGELQISQEFLNSLRNTLIIIDECQNLWNQQGMNTYGFIIGLLIKKSEEYNIRFVFLSGTIINNNICELASIYSVLNTDKFIDESEYLSEKEILGTKLKTLKMSKFSEINEFMSDKFLYYVNNPNTKSVISKISLKLDEETELVDNNLPLKFRLNKHDKTITEIENLDRVIITSEDKLIPTVWHLGNKIIKNENQDMVIYNLEVQGLQKEKYDEWLMKQNNKDIEGEGDEGDEEMESKDENKENKESNNLDDLDDEKLSLHDGFFQSNDEIYYTSGVYTGKGLEYPRLKNYSIIGAEMVRLCLYNTLRGEKVICYHDKVSKFGIKQYIEFLKVNGYIEYGTVGNNNTRCQKCGQTLGNHISSNHSFTPMCYAALYGDIPDYQRKKLTAIWNNPNNLTGEVISVMMISKVAYAGVSFYNTTNMIILSKISNISKWKQICGRIVRTASHSLLPNNKKIAKIYTMAVHSDIESNKMDLETKYYSIKNILNNEILDITQKLYHNSITNKLFNAKLEIKSDSIYNTFIDDVIDELSIVIHRMNLNNKYPWTKEGFIQRIKSNLNSLSYIDYSRFDDDFIQTIILEKNYVKMFRYKNLEKIFYLPTNNLISETEISDYPTFKFSDLSVIKVENRNVKAGIEKLIDIVNKSIDVIIIKNHLIKLMKLMNNNPTQLFEYSAFWKAIYMIHDEYYEDDDKHFIKNHSTKGRDFEKIAGLYVGNTIYLKDGSVKKITINKNINEWENIPFKFKISCYSNNKGDDALWYLKVIIIEDSTNYVDKRKINTGLNCASFDISKLVKYLPKIDISKTKKEICIDLISILCDYALEKKLKLSNVFE